MSRLKDKVVLVTGAAQGTGEATARLASSEGARVVVTDIQSEKAAAVAKSLGDSAIAGVSETPCLPVARRGALLRS